MFDFRRLSFVALVAIIILIVGCSSERSKPTQFNQNSSTIGSADSLSNFNPIVGSEITVDSLQRLTMNLLKDSSGRIQQRVSATGWVFNINMPSFFSQVDPAWKDLGLGYNACGNSTINAYGCYLCCVSMMYAKWGYRGFTPPVLNNWSYAGSNHFAFWPANTKAGNCGDLLWIDHALQYGACRTYQNISYDQIYTALSRGIPVVIEINYPTTSWKKSHFMVIYAFDGSRYWVLDPLRQPNDGATPLWGTGYGGSLIKSIKILGYSL